MKPSPQYDFPVSVRCQTWEEEPEVAALYQGIFDVTLNHTLSVMFVPEVEINDNFLFPILPDNVDEISTELEARLVTIALSRYTVTPNSLLAAKEEIISLSGWRSSQEGVIFFVTPQEFSIFSTELSMLAKEIPSVHSDKKVSEIKNFEVTKFLIDRIIPSKYFAEEDLQILGTRRLNLAFSSHETQLSQTPL